MFSPYVSLERPAIQIVSTNGTSTRTNSAPREFKVAPVIKTSLKRFLILGGAFHRVKRGVPFFPLIVPARALAASSAPKVALKREDIGEMEGSD